MKHENRLHPRSPGVCALGHEASSLARVRSLAFHHVGNFSVEILVREHGLPASGLYLNQFFAALGQRHGPWIPNSPVDAVSKAESIWISAIGDPSWRT